MSDACGDAKEVACMQEARGQAFDMHGHRTLQDGNRFRSVVRIHGILGPDAVGYKHLVHSGIVLMGADAGSFFLGEGCGAFNKSYVPIAPFDQAGSGDPNAFLLEGHLLIFERRDHL